MSEFFQAKKPAAVLKHELLGRYLHMYVNKTRGRSTGGRVTYLDCYAGPGSYEDGAKGSPAVAVDTAAVVGGAGEKSHDALDGIFIEQEAQSVKALREHLAAEGLDWPVHRGHVEDVLPGILGDIDAGTSLFVFLDPFGLGIPMTLMKQILGRSKPLRQGMRMSGAPTEVLLNFSFPGLRRNAGHLTSTSTNERYLKSRATILGRLDATLGAKWWRKVWADGDADAEERVYEGYLERLAALPGEWHWYTAPVSARWEGPALYSLVFLTQHPDGLWLFNEAVSSATEEFRTVCFENAGQLDLEPADARWAEWIAEIARNIERGLGKGKTVVPGVHMKSVYGRTLGFARERHIRAAVKSLHQAGKTGTDGKGNVQNMRIKPLKK